MTQLNISQDINNRAVTQHPIMLHCFGERCPGPGFTGTDPPGSWQSRVWRAAEEEEEDEEACADQSMSLQRL